jgi:hypothetical protein
MKTITPSLGAMSPSSFASDSSLASDSSSLTSDPSSNPNYELKTFMVFDIEGQKYEVCTEDLWWPDRIVAPSTEQAKPTLEWTDGMLRSLFGDWNSANGLGIQNRSPPLTSSQWRHGTPGLQIGPVKVCTATLLSLSATTRIRAQANKDASSSFVALCHALSTR